MGGFSSTPDVDALRVLTCNVNGIRSADQKGFLRYLRAQSPDVVCLQEMRARAEQLPRRLRAPRGYHAHLSEAERPGYSGVAVWSKQPPLRVEAGFGWPDVDPEARVLRVDLEALTVVSLYVPSGSSGDERQGFKMGFLERLDGWLDALRAEGRPVLVAGDFNIAHTELDLENYRGNRKNSGFLPEERAWLDRLYGRGWVDAHRRVLEPEERVYTWWSNRGRAFEKDVGWRLDLQVVTPELGAAARSAEVYKRRRYSDHAPLTIDYQLLP